MTIELTTGQKLQTAVILLALGIAGYLVFANSRPHFDDTVNSWPLSHDHPTDITKRIDKEHPVDPKNHEDLTVFASSDGQVDFIEYPNDPDKHLKIVWRPEKRQAGKIYIYYLDPMLALARIKDPFRHALAYAVYFKLYEPALYARSQSLLGQVQPALTKEELDKEGEARKNMDAANTVTESMVASGTFHSELIDPLMKALKAFQANTKDISKDAGKQEMARKVLTLAAAYEKKIQEERSVAIDKYITAMEGIMTDEQKDSLIAAVAKREQKPAVSVTTGAGRRGRGGTTTAPARGGAAGRATTAPARGGATTAPARGGTATTGRAGGTRAGRGAATPAPAGPEATTAPGR